MDNSYSTYNKGKNDTPEQGLLSSDDFYHYSRIWDHMKENIMEVEESLRESALESINESKNIKLLLKNRKISSILDVALPHAVPSNYLNIIKTIEEDLRIYAIDCYASHVLETILKCCLKHLQETGVSSTTEKKSAIDDEKPYITQFLVKSCKFICNNTAEFITEIYANHVLRTALEVVAGIEVPRYLSSKLNSNCMSSLWKMPMIVPQEIGDLLLKFINRLCNLSSLPDIISNQCGSAVLQCAVTVLHSFPDSKKLLKKLVNSIINNGFSEIPEGNELNELFTSMPCCRLLEAVMAVATSKQQTFIYESLFKNRLHLLCVHKNGNFAAQKLCENCECPEMFNEIFHGMSPSIEGSLEKGYSGILLSLVKACKRFKLNQSKIMNCLMCILQCADPDRQDNIAMLLMRFLKFEDLQNVKDYPYQLHGVLVVQELLQFKKYKKIANSVLNMTCINILDVACDSKASYIINAFINSETIQCRKKNQLIDKFQGLEMELACSKSGSRALEVLWNFADWEIKTEMAKRLLKADKKLKNNFFGRIIYNKFHNENKD